MFVWNIYIDCSYLHSFTPTVIYTHLHLQLSTLIYTYSYLHSFTPTVIYTHLHLQLSTLLHLQLSTLIYTYSYLHASTLASDLDYFSETLYSTFISISTYLYTVLD